MVIVEPDRFPGDATGLPLPPTPAALLAAGPAWLTAAFRAFGTIGDDNHVVRIAHHADVAAGNSGRKLLLDVDYAVDAPGLHSDLFVKFSRDLDDPFRDRRRAELAAEVRLAMLARLPSFPVPVAEACFADFEAASGTGLLITERIAFGRDGIEPLRRKCHDRALGTRAIDHYRATMTALARLAAAHKAGRLSPDAERLFPFEAASAAADLPIGYDASGLDERLGRLRDFAATCPALLPAALRAPVFLDRVARDAHGFLAREGPVRAWLHADPDLVALCHWNSNLDNAWFRREADGTLGCGLLDWGMVRQMNIAYGIWGGLSAAEPDMLVAELDGLLALFVRVAAAEGGPAIAPERLGRHFDLSLMLLGLALMIDVPALILARAPDAAAAAGPDDPIVTADPVVEGFLKVFTNLLTLWRERDFASSLAMVP